MSPLFQNKSKTRKGDCEACSVSIGVDLTMDSHNMWLCESCLEKERNLEIRTKAATELVNAFQRNRDSINIVADLHNAASTPIIELKGAIWSNPEIPDDKKQLVYCREMQAHVAKLNEVVKNQRKELEISQNQLAMWTTNAQSEVGKLRSELQGEFKALHIDYKPTPVKVIKPKEHKPSTPKKSQKVLAQEAAEATSKYGLDAVMASTVKMLADVRKISADEAAQMLSQSVKK